MSQTTNLLPESSEPELLFFLGYLRHKRARILLFRSFNGRIYRSLMRR
jgi:hypothetical protein